MENSACCFSLMEEGVQNEVDFQVINFEVYIYEEIVRYNLPRAPLTYLNKRVLDEVYSRKFILPRINFFLFLLDQF